MGALDVLSGHSSSRGSTHTSPATARRCTLGAAASAADATDTTEAAEAAEATGVEATTAGAGCGPATAAAEEPTGAGPTETEPIEVDTAGRVGPTAITGRDAVIPTPATNGNDPVGRTGAAAAGRRSASAAGIIIAGRSPAPVVVDELTRRMRDGWTWGVR
jgi:hypothetical protein